MKQIRRRVTAFLLAAALLLSLGSGHTGIAMIDCSVTAEVSAASGNVTQSRVLKSCGIPSIGRSASEGLWDIRVDGKNTLCLNSGKTMNNGDHASGKTYDAVTYSNQSLAKVLTYYFGTKEQKGGTELFLLCQAYAWACGKGTSKTQAMVEAAQNINVSASDAKAVYDEIQKTDPYGQITYYTIDKCAKGKNIQAHQHLLSWSGSGSKPEYGIYSQPYTAKDTEEIKISITKNDAETKKGLAGAVYDLYRDGVKITTLTTDSTGTAVYAYTQEYKVTVPADQEYIWVKNWNSLSAAQQAAEKQKGYYSSEALAVAAWMSEQKPRAELLLEAEKNASHVWKAAEVQPPKNHRISGSGVQEITESKGITDMEFYFSDYCAEMTLQLVKKSSGSCGVESSLKDAKYGMYAAENIYASDNQTVKYVKDELVATLVTDDNGSAKATGLIPGKYWMMELCAPRGFETDSTRHSVDLTYTSGSSELYKITVTDQPVLNKVKIMKTFDQAAMPVETVTEKQLRPEYVPGICSHHMEHDESCGYAEGEDAHDCTFFCEECAYTHVFAEKEIPITDTFVLIDSRGNTAAEIEIGNDGCGESPLLPYGTYTLHQTASTKGYAPVPDRMITIRDAVEDITVRLDDPREAPRIYLTKYQIIEDEETDTFQKEAEQDAEFALYGPDGELFTCVKTDSRGVAYFGEIKEMGTYRIHQISGTANYQKMEDQTVNITEKKSYFITGEDTYCGSKIRIQKYLEKEDKEPEAGAEFVLLDAERINKTLGELAAMDEEERLEYIFSLEEENKEAILGTMRTDSQGKAAMILTEWQEKDHPEGFYVFQTHGEAGYALAEPVSSQDLEVKTENGMRIYVLQATDAWDDWADISLIKHKTTGENRTVPEEGAVFRLIDKNEKIVGEQSTDTDGRAVFQKVALGTYRIEQILGVETHEMMTPVYVTLTKKDKHQEIRLSEKPLTDREKEILFTLTKRSADTGILLGQAQYELYRITVDENGQEIKTRIAGLMTEADSEDQAYGTATISLPFGTYMIRESYPPNGYLPDEQEYRFTLDMDSVTYKEDGTGSYELTFENAPVQGTIALSKTGNTVSGYDEESESFSVGEKVLPGAVYGLYARENISRDDGSLVSAAGTLIDKKTTDSQGQIRFTRRDDNGQETDRFYMGRYYVKEVSAPEGYALDTTEYEVYLNWDNKTEQFDDIRKPQYTPDTEAPVGNNSPDPDAGRYVLETGEELNARLQNSGASSVTFTWEKAPEGAALTNVSSDKSDGIVLWNEGSRYYISTQLAGQVMYFNAVSSHMFANCTSLTEIRFDNTDTSRMVDAGYMFYRCSSLSELDLSSFNVKNTENANRMFAYCSSLRTVYVNDQKLEKAESYETDIPSHILAEPKNDVITGHTFVTEDFRFTLFYENGKCEEIYPSQSEMQIDPHTADVSGKRNVQITFTSGGRYAQFGTVECQVQVVDPEEISAERMFSEPEVLLQIKNEAQDVTIQIIKTDADDADKQMLEGAEFTLFAACEIIDGKGNTLFQKDQPIAVQISGNSDFSYVEFAHLPSAIYKKDPQALYMYYIRETKAPEGYEGTDKTVYVTGEVKNSTRAEFVYGYSGVRTEAQNIVFYGSDAHMFTNTRKENITLKKEWTDGDASRRPETVQVTVTLPDFTQKQYTLEAAKDWSLVTELNAGLFDGFTQGQIRQMFNETKVNGYVEKGSTWDPETQTFTFRNVTEEKISSTVEKMWDDKNDDAGIRPEKVDVTLYANELPVKTVTLPTVEGGWSYTQDQLAATDEQGVAIRYSWKEEATDLISQDSGEGYLSLVKEDSQKTIITNYHEVKTVNRSIKKIWKDQDDAQKIRPLQIKVQLLANGEPVKLLRTKEGYCFADIVSEQVTDCVLLSEKENWEAMVTDLPEYDKEQKITYTWKELEDKQSYITGESTVGYAAAYAADLLDRDRTIVTNSHTYFAGAKVTVHKKIAKENLNFEVDEPSFTIALAGTDIYGKEHYLTETVTFTRDDLNGNDEDAVVKTVEFTGLPYGEYRVMESGMEGIYEKKSLLSLTPETQAEDTCFTVVIDPKQKKENGSCDQEMIFENQAVRGSITMIKYEDDGKKTLQGVTFCLKDAEQNEMMYAVTDEQGKAVFTGLLPGKYTVTETKTKDGYALLEKPVTVQLPCRVSSSEAAGEHLSTTAAVEYKGAYYFYHLNYEVTDQPSLKLPLTGSYDHWKAYLEMVVAAGLLYAVATVRMRRKRNVPVVKTAFSETSEP